MSLKTVLWVFEAAPIDDQGALLVLWALADRADENGKNAWPSQEWIAQRARCTTRTVRRHLSTLLEKGLIRRGDQQLVSHLRSDRRPVVYDLAVEKRRDEPVADSSSEAPQDSTARGDNLSSRAAEDPSDGRTAVSARNSARADRTGSHDRTLLSYKPSLNLNQTTKAPTGLSVDVPSTADSEALFDAPAVPRPRPAVDPPEPPSGPTAQTLLGEWIDHCPSRPPSTVIGQVAKQLRVLLEDGIAPEVIRAGLADWHNKRLHPSALPSLVHHAQLPPASGSSTDDRVRAVLALKRGPVSAGPFAIGGTT